MNDREKKLFVEKIMEAVESNSSHVFGDIVQEIFEAGVEEGLHGGVDEDATYEAALERARESKEAMMDMD